MTGLVAAGAVALTASGLTFGVWPGCAEPTGHWGLGAPEAIEISLAYDPPVAVTGWGMVLSVTPIDEPTPSPATSYVQPAVIHDLLIDGDLVFTALDRAGVHVLRLDLHGRTTLVPVARISTPGQARDLALADDLLAVADGDAGLLLVDVSVPGQPRHHVTVPAIVSVSGVTLDHTRAVVLDGKVLRVLDVSQPAIPLELSSTPTDMWLVRAEVTHDIAYIAYAKDLPWGENVGGVVAYDLADPRHPTVLGRVTGSSDAIDLRVVEEQSFTAYGHSLNSWAGALQIASFDDPMNPATIVERVYGGPVRAVATTADVTLVGASGVEVLNTADPSNPVPVAFARDDGLDAHAVLECGGVLVVAQARGRMLRMLSLDDGRPQAEVGSIQLSTAGMGLACRENVVFAGASVVTSVDIGDPTQPRILDRPISDPRGSDHLVLHGDVLYTGGSPPRVFDVRDPADMVYLNDLDVPGHDPALVMDGDYLLAVYRNYPGGHRLRILDASVATEPAVVSEVSLPAEIGFSGDVAVDLGVAVIVGDRVTTVDVSDPRFPEVLGSSVIPDGVAAALHVTLDGARAALSHGWTPFDNADVSVFDLSSPAEPRLAGTIHTAGSATATLWVGNGLVVADGPQGVTSFDLSGCGWRVAERPINGTADR